MRRYIVLSLFLILSTTGITNVANSQATPVDDIAVEDAKDLMKEMSKQYSECAALFMDIMRLVYQKEGKNAKFNDLNRRTKFAFVTAKGFTRIAGEDPEAASENINALADTFIDEMTKGNNNDKFQRLKSKCEQMTDKSEK